MSRKIENGEKRRTNTERQQEEDYLTYLWINPVSERMISEQNLERILTEHHLTQVRCCKDWCSSVKKQYENLMNHANGMVADARCPEAVNLIERYKEEKGVPIQVADIEPILIHCARELSARSDLADGDKIITTPCRILAEQGNALELPRTRFVSWKDFLAELGETPEDAPEASPIPPGFFADLKVPVVSLSGREEIETYLEQSGEAVAGGLSEGEAAGQKAERESERRKKVSDSGYGKTNRDPLLLELLYCSQGCHMGDGVR